MNLVLAVHPKSVQMNSVSVKCLFLYEHSLLELCIFCSNKCPSELIGESTTQSQMSTPCMNLVFAVRPKSVQMNSVGVR